jgi:hypothetical protein
MLQRTTVKSRARLLSVMGLKRDRNMAPKECLSLNVVSWRADAMMVFPPNPVRASTS